MTAPAPSGPIRVCTTDADGTREVARVIAAQLRAGDLLVLDGPLGAGKTTFTQGIGDALRVRGSVASPTFVIARAHPSLGDGPELVHVDAYRLGGLGDIEDLDLDTDLDRAVTVVEWGRDLVEQLTDSHLLIEIDRPHVASGTDPDDPDEPRTLTVHPGGPRWDGEAVRALTSALTELTSTSGEER